MWISSSERFFFSDSVFLSPLPAPFQLEEQIENTVYTLFAACPATHGENVNQSSENKKR